MLTLAAIKEWPINQLDIKNAFLNGVLQETVFIRQSPTFDNAVFPPHVCRLKKALYGLKQAPRAWVDMFYSFLFAQGSVSSVADSFLFVLNKGADMVVLLLYVSCTFVTGTTADLFESFL